MDIRKQIYAILKQADQDIRRLQLNTVVSAAMKLFNLLQANTDSYLMHEGCDILLRILAPITPHIAHSIWQELRFSGAIIDASWPKIAQEALKTDIIEMLVQVNGKLRSKITVPIDANQKSIEKIALSNANVKRFVENKSIRKIIVVPRKLVNVVI